MSTENTITQKTALITGCSEPHSLGAALALQLLKEQKYRVFATARRLDTLKLLAAEGCDILELDVQDAESIRKAAEEVKKVAGRLDLLINNAGVSPVTPLLDVDLDRSAEVFNINALGPVRVVQGFAKLLIRTANDPSLKDTGPVGIINIGSFVRLGLPWAGIYSGSKAALEAITHTMRLEFAPLNVKAVYVHLGAVKTAMSAAEKPFPSTSAQTSGVYNNWDEIYKAREDGTADVIKGAPTAAEAAAQILSYHLAGQYPSRGIYAGGSSFLLRYLFPLLPRFVLDFIFVRYARTDMTQTPRYE